MISSNQRCSPGSAAAYHLRVETYGEKALAQIARRRAELALSSASWDDELIRFVAQAEAALVVMRVSSWNCSRGPPSSPRWKADERSPSRTSRWLRMNNPWRGPWIR